MRFHLHNLNGWPDWAQNQNRVHLITSECLWGIDSCTFPAARTIFADFFSPASELAALLLDRFCCCKDYNAIWLTDSARTGGKRDNGRAGDGGVILFIIKVRAMVLFIMIKEYWQASLQQVSCYIFILQVLGLRNCICAESDQGSSATLWENLLPDAFD